MLSVNHRPLSDTCPLVIAMMDSLLEERDRQRKREMDKERILIGKDIKCQKSINKDTAENSDLHFHMSGLRY